MLMIKEKTKETVLIVDDIPDNLQLLTKMLSSNGYIVRAVKSGEAAITSIQKKPPDLILMDIIMPGLNGFDVCRKIKAMKQFKNIPIIFLTALNDVKQKVLAFQSGGVDYITKPFSSEEVLTRIHTHLQLFRLNNELIEKNKDLSKRNRKMKQKQQELKQALDNIKKLQGLIPICAKCKKIRDDEGFWDQVEVYISKHSDVKFSHGICPDCARLLYPDIFD